MSVSKQTVLETLYTFKTLQDEEITNKLSTLGLSGITGGLSSSDIDSELSNVFGLSNAATNADFNSALNNIFFA